MTREKWKGRLWLKVIAFVVAAVTGLTTIVGVVLMILCIGTDNLAGESIVWNMQRHMTTQYGAYLVEQGREDDGAWDVLEDGSLTYAVEKLTFVTDGSQEAKDIIGQREVVYGDEGWLLQMTRQKETKGLLINDYPAEGAYSYSVDSLEGICNTEYYTHDESYVYPTENGDGLICETQEYYDEYGEEIPYAEDSRVPAGTYVFYRTYMMVNEDISDHATELMGTFSFGKTINTEISFGSWYDVLERLGEKKDIVTFSGGVSDYLWTPYVIVCLLEMADRVDVAVFLISLILFAVSFILLMTMSGHSVESQEIRIRRADRMPYEIYLVLAVTGVSLGVTGSAGIIYLYYTGSFKLEEMIASSLLCGGVWMALTLAFSMSTAVRIKSGRFWKYTIIGWILGLGERFMIMPIKRFREMVRSNISLSIRLAVVLLALGLMQLIVLGASSCGCVVISLFLLYKATETMGIYYLVFMAKRLKDGGERVANGNYKQPIDTTYMVRSLKEHGEDINRVGEGIALAVEEQMKSERLKTELITNVSHDIKTPLTSIINYVDLIKKENVEDPKVREYIDVLDRQSARLKKLITDLLEASKASTGNVELHMESCNASVMISQIIGDYQEKLEEQGIEVVVTGSEQDLMICADAKHLWRVFDNIMSNICKYTQEHTRVYVAVEKDTKGVAMTFKNISRYPLNISSEELMERFVRGDASRNTEGHGLGLSIAQSLTELMGGRLEVMIDGDLFKVIVRMDS